jgi:uncharacterized Zn finger protein
MRYYLVSQIVRTEGNERLSDDDILFLADSDKYEITEVEIPKKVSR